MARSRRARKDNSSKRRNEPVRLGPALRRSNTNPWRVLLGHGTQRTAGAAGRLSSETDRRRKITNRPVASGDRSAHKELGSCIAKTIHALDASERTYFATASSR